MIIEIQQTTKIDLEALLQDFERSWKTPFDGSKRTCCMMFEDLVFGRHKDPKTASQIVEAVKSHILQQKAVESGSSYALMA